MTKNSPRASIRRLRRRGIEEGIGEIEFLRFVLRGQRKPSGSKRRPRRQPYAVRGVFALLRSLRCPCIGHSERAEKPAPPVILRRFSSGHPELVAARRQGRRRTAFAASPEAFAAPLPKKFFDTFWEPSKAGKNTALFLPSPSGGRCHSERMTEEGRRSNGKLSAPHQSASPPASPNGGSRG